MKIHQELKKTLIDFNIVSSFDYIRTFDENNFTDFSLNKVSAILNNESKYIMVGLSKSDSKPFVLYNSDLNSINDKIHYEMIKSDRVRGYNPERNRVLVYHEGEGIVRFGNIYPNDLRVRFEFANIDDLIRKENYFYKLPTETRHAILQSYLFDLGSSLGYTVHIPKSDISRVKSVKNEILIAKTPIPSDLKISKRDIENVDVIWIENQNPIVAFEIEFSLNFTAAIKRLFSFNEAFNLNQKSFNIICSDDYFSFYKYCKNNYYFINKLIPIEDIYFLDLSRLNDCLIRKDLYGFCKQIDLSRKQFFTALQKVNIDYTKLN